jgi:CRP-like cAMP-binding protein
LQEGSVRSATVRAETDVEFLTISRDDYNRILGAVSEEQLAAKIKFLHGLPAFAGVPASMIR